MACDPLRDLRAWQARLERLAAPHGVSALDAWTPPVDVYETEDRYVVTVEVPGLTREEIALAVEDNRLSIRGNRALGAPESTTRHYHQVERGHGSFQRTFAFVERVQTDGIAADLREGVLTVTLHKATPRGPRHIEVR